ncbi:response regulator [Psychrobacter sp. ANT_H59]|uniref:response regulator n=1 Tax=Psychrobacter sp. ANT_H59 TaxID=2597354 RepID=UPI0011ECF1D5|nr:response regulator [Psychrobacter sp. ANT_H59]KAA0934626.1 response regulator [Psychrobacter sp. ANT_H59]
MNELENDTSNNISTAELGVEAKPKLAFIDDEQRILRSMKLLFRKTHDVFITTDPAEYIDYIKNNHVHVAVSDQRMPERVGVDILREVKDVSPSTMRILLTGYADLNAIIGSINDGEIYRYLTKPCKSEELLAVVGRATEIALTYNPDEDAEQFDSSGNKQTLLVIDETNELIEQIRKQFSNNYKVLHAKGLEEAYDYLANEDIGVCITDINVSGENIAPIIFTLKQDAPHLVVLVQTEFQDAGLLIDLINKGQVYRCLPKPMRASLLEISVNRAFQHHAKLKASPELVKRYEVEHDPENDVRIDLSSRVRSLIGKLRKRFSL